MAVLFFLSMNLLASLLITIFSVITDVRIGKNRTHSSPTKHQSIFAKSPRPSRSRTCVKENRVTNFNNCHGKP